MKRRGEWAICSAFALGVLLAWWAPATRAQSTVFRYDGAGNMTGRTSTATDPLNCGAVGNACAAGWACCAGVCVNVAADPANCGACGRVCTKGPRLCYQATCVLMCPADSCPVNGTCGSCSPPGEVMKTTKPAP